MPKLTKNTVVLSNEEFDSLAKIKKNFDLFVELNKLIKSLSDKEFQLLEGSLELTKKEMKSQNEQKIKKKNNV